MGGNSSTINNDWDLCRQPRSNYGNRLVHFAEPKPDSRMVQVPRVTTGPELFLYFVLICFGLPFLAYLCKIAFLRHSHLLPC